MFANIFFLKDELPSPDVSFFDQGTEHFFFLVVQRYNFVEVLEQAR
jgi:hypothetical protein